MKYSQSDFVVYNTINGSQVYTWVKNVFDEEKYYILDFEDSKALESELSSYDAANFSVPSAPQSSNIDDYHRDTMIDRIVTALQPKQNSLDLKVSKLAGKIIFETEVKDTEILEDQKSLIGFVEKHNKMIAKIQERFNGRWGINIPVELRFHENKASLNPIKI
ncbi:hypothetical protein [Pedobacter kyonggii]|uniref:Uncharacterized protein n=1 Tax=Pedobacter kyonggii TaxID=1926871 RepID=A0A4Q9HGR2_9SPHI|nr:hypothetical protein [Pedobacter kyonggii]TBO44464.1 hypothetical protein EYS08_03930 [Pedobacter kyonggii]